MFSPIQEKIIKVIKECELITIQEIAKEVYKGSKNKPLSPNNSVVSAISYINVKCHKNKLNWFIDGEGVGRKGKTVHIKKVK